MFKGIEIVDFADSGLRGIAFRGVLAAQPAAEPLTAPGHFAVELMSGLKAAANRPDHPFQTAELTQALQDAESFEILIERSGAPISCEIITVASAEEGHPSRGHQPLPAGGEPSNAGA